LQQEEGNKRPNWWYNTYKDAHLDELLDMNQQGRPKRASDLVNYNDDAQWNALVGVSHENRPKRGKGSKMVNYALMAYLQNSFKPQHHEEDKGSLE
jgi:hypothetical protein